MDVRNPVPDVDFRELFDSLAGTYLVLLPNDPIYTIVAVNHAYQRAIMRSSDDLLGRPLFEAFPDNPDDPAATGVSNLRASLLRVLATRAPDAMAVQKYDLQRPASVGGGFEERYWSPLNSPVLGSDGEVRAIAHHVEDVTDFVRLQKQHLMQGRLTESERLRADRMEAELFVSSRQLAESQNLMAERDRMHARLRDSESRYRTLVETVSSILWNTDAGGAIVEETPSWGAFTGQSREQYSGWGWTDAIHPDDRARVADRWRRALGEKKGYESTYRLRRRDGQYRDVIARGAPVLDDERNVREWIGNCDDVTDSRRAGYALRESEQRFVAAFAHAPIGMVLANPRGKFIEVNPRFAEMLGMTREELLSGDAEPFTHPEDVEATRLFAESLHQPGNPRSVLEKRYIRKDGSLLWARISGTMRLDENGEPMQIVGIIEDITERKRFEEALRDSQKRLEQVFAQAPVAVCVMRGSDLRYELVNPHYEEFLPSRDFIGRPIVEVIPELDPKVMAILNEVMNTGQPYSATEFLVPLDRNEDGVPEDTWFNVVYHPLREVDGKVSGIVTVAIDVTAQVKDRHEVERVNRELEEFAYVASHDLQEPLRMVNTFTQLLMREFSPLLDASTRDYASYIDQGVRRMQQLLHDLLQFSRIIHAEKSNNGRLPVANLNHSMAQALTVLQNRIDDCGAEIHWEPLPDVAGDESQLSQVFQNLLSNAIKYRNSEERLCIQVNSRKRGDNYVVAFGDNGIGFDQTHAERIFGLFKRLHKDQYPGTGLGLAISKRIVERYGGKIWAESSPGRGSTFYLSLPEAPLNSDSE